ncbi:MULTISPECIES: hypothetical protein [Stutzerimonas stutzeri group]|uniref:hypothetical protein n=1 Tax=Stutzerimonas stutzeri group TaxID=136846 RepID=UPI001648A6F6|nr:MULTISPECIES: hypothetical protein [Stutzerimonas stutzeri group]MBK3759332.1 hypothetical protein [Stutzerimonas frequens]UIP32550.1 hypothetical protein LW136_20935 [Stutzerimonas kunmingensis]CAD2261414.1 hypothetical protein PSEUDT2_04138 [Stutzerimonas stutzeri]
MNIVIDTPYTTVTELARRTGQSESTIRKEIKNGRLLIREKTEGSKEAVLVNMIHIAMEAAEQAERVRTDNSKSSSQR